MHAGLIEAPENQSKAAWRSRPCVLSAGQEKCIDTLCRSRNLAPVLRGRKMDPVVSARRSTNFPRGNRHRAWQMGRDGVDLRSEFSCRSNPVHMAC